MGSETKGAPKPNPAPDQRNGEKYLELLLTRWRSALGEITEPQAGGYGSAAPTASGGGGHVR